MFQYCVYLIEVRRWENVGLCVAMLGFGYMLLVMLIAATISIAEHSRTHIGLVPDSPEQQRVPIGQEALELIKTPLAV